MSGDSFRMHATRPSSSSESGSQNQLNQARFVTGDSRIIIIRRHDEDLGDHYIEVAILELDQKASAVLCACCARKDRAP